MDEHLTQDERNLIQSAAEFARRQVPGQLGEWERAGRMPQATLKAAVDAGLLSIQVPVAYGGRGFGYRCKMRVTEEISRVSMAAAFSLVNLQNVAAKLANDATEPAAREFVPKLMVCERFGATALTEPHAGTDFSNIAMQAHRVDGGWSLSGEKSWITNAVFADVFVCYAQTDAALGWRGIGCFLVDAKRDGFARAPAIDVFGGKAIGAGGFQLSDFFVPDEHLIHPPGEAFKKALGSINGARTYVAAMCCGMLAAGLATATDYLKNRTAFGGPLSDRQGLRWQLADIATELEAARLLTYKAAELVESGSSEAVLSAAHAKKFSARVTERGLLDCIQMLGANGMRSEYGLGAHLACAKIAGYVDGSTEIQNERIAALLIDA
ncbi:MAG: hypothetical protein HOI95_01675 [Chromatiales bacterium]|nr:hypothetical protein [Chromatiales bacterium]